ncbi:hypothetical protein PINS_up016579 [Pythium insidiosum]|nr:hypothetical protein PINS_up016579 [Pythium insidiosum]
MQLARRQAVPLWRALMGPTNSATARATHPWTLRARFGVDGTQNATHGSDAVASARRELRFFFGATALTAAPVTSVRALAAQPLPLPFHAPETVSRVLVRGVAEMMRRRDGFESSLDACRWLGHWLLAQHEASLAAAEPSASTPAPAPATTSSSTQRMRQAPTRQPPKTDGERMSADEFKLVAVAVDSDAFPSGSARKSDLLALLRAEAETWGFTVVDLRTLELNDPNAAAQQLVRQILDGGRRRVLALDVPLAATAFCSAWRERLASAGGRAVSVVVEIGASGQSPCSCREHAREAFGSTVPFLTYRLVDVPAVPTLRHFFEAFVSPTLVLLDDDASVVGVERWRRIAERFGYVLLSFEDVVESERLRENDPNAALAQWRRTGGRLPDDVVLQALKRYLVDPASLQGVKCQGSTHGTALPVVWIPLARDRRGQVGAARDSSGCRHPSRQRVRDGDALDATVGRSRSRARRGAGDAGSGRGAGAWTHRERRAGRRRRRRRRRQDPTTV